MNEVNDMGQKRIHYGKGHTHNTQKCKLPERLLVL